jgi:hypothetical protein
VVIVKKQKARTVAIILASLLLLTILTPTAFANSISADSLLQQSKKAVSDLERQWSDTGFDNLTIALTSGVEDVSLSTAQTLALIEVYNSIFKSLQKQPTTMSEHLQTLLFNLEYELTNNEADALDEVNLAVALMIPEITEDTGGINDAIIKNIENGKKSEIESSCKKIFDLIANSKDPSKYEVFQEYLVLMAVKRAISLTPEQVTPKDSGNQSATDGPSLSLGDIGKVKTEGVKGGSIKEDTQGAQKGGSIQIGGAETPTIDPTKEQSWVLVSFQGSEDAAYQKINAITEDDKVGFSDIKQIANAMAMYAKENNIVFYFIDDDNRYMVSYGGELFIKEYTDAVMTYEETIAYFNAFGLVSVKFEKI